MKPRSTLKAYFKKGAIPKESEFADLIDSMLIQDEDNLLKSPNDPLSIKATGAEEALLNFYRVEEGEGGVQARTISTWQLKQKPDDRSGLSIHYDGGDSRLFIDSETGNVGIGTNEPAARLHTVVQEPAAEMPANILRIDSWIANNTDVMQGIHLFKKYDNVLYGWKIEGRGEFNHSATLQIVSSQQGEDKVRMTIARDTGNVGIGTTNPQTTLDVDGDVRISKWLSVGPGGDGGRVWMEYDTSHYVPRLVLSDQDDPPRIQFQQVGGDDGSEENPQFASWIGHRTSGSNDVMVSCDSFYVHGNVGIGTDKPNSKLSVAGGIAVGQSFASDEAYPAPENGMTIEGNVGIGTRVPTARLGVVGNVSVGEWANDSRYPAPENGMLVSGNVGIGTTEPEKRLHIRGWSGAANLLIIEEGHANNSNASTLLNSLADRTLIIGGPWRDEIYFYWKHDGKKYVGTLQGSSL